LEVVQNKPGQNKILAAAEEKKEEKIGNYFEQRKEQRP
jgi:hypothetical protein